MEIETAPVLRVLPEQIEQAGVEALLPRLPAPLELGDPVQVSLEEILKVPGSRLEVTNRPRRGRHGETL